MQKHLAIYDSLLASKILSGEKTTIVYASKSKIAPFGLVNMGDLVYVKPRKSDIICQFRVKKVQSFEGLDEKDLKDLKEKYSEDIPSGMTYLTIIFISDVVPLITSPITYKKRDLKSWLVLE